MPLSDCIFQFSDDGNPDQIADLSTLSINIDNQGIATVSLSVITKKTGVINFNPCMRFNNRQFSGFVIADQPQQLDGADYTEHKLTMLGTVSLEGTSGNRGTTGSNNQSGVGG